MAYTYRLAGMGSKTSGTSGSGYLELINTDYNLFRSPVRSNIPKYSKITNVTAYSTITRNIAAAAYMTIYIAGIEGNNRIGSEFKTSSWSTKSLTANADVTSYFYSETDRAGEFNDAYTQLTCHYKGNSTKYTSSNNYFDITYEKPVYNINVSSNNTNYGTVSGSTSKEVEVTDQTVTITATPKTGYRFVKWSEDGNTNASRTITISQNSGISGFTTNLNLTAIFEPITYTATFKNYDGTVLDAVTVNYGSTPSYTGSTPTKPSTAQYNYTFSGWSPSLGAITSNTEYVAQFTSTLRKYTVTWKNYDGTVLETDTTEYGRMPTYDSTTPTKPSDTENSYSFAGWHITISEVQGDIEYIATFTAIPLGYTVVWKNWDGTILETDEKVPYGSMPSYDGNIPTKEPTAKYTYVFSEWDSTVVEVTKNVTYTAVFTAIINEYVVTTKDSANGTIEGGGTYEYDTTVVLTAIPDEGYEFIKWSDGDTNKSKTFVVTGNVSYSAVFRLNNVYIGQHRPKSVHTDGHTVVLVFSEEIPQEKSFVDSVDGIHFVLSNTVPDNMVEVDELYIGTIKIYEKV